jgi:hypothetical protein
LRKTFYGFYPTTVTFEVVFEDFVPNRMSNGMSPIQKKERISLTLAVSGKNLADLGSVQISFKLSLWLLG